MTQQPNRTPGGPPTSGSGPAERHSPGAAGPIDPAVEAHCRAAFGSWDGYRGLGGNTRQHFTEDEREHWRGVFRPVVEEKSA